MRDITYCYRKLADTLVTSAVNDMANWYAQQDLYPNGIKDVERVAKEKGKSIELMTHRYYMAQFRADEAMTFLGNEPYLAIFTSYTAEELLSFARRKSVYMLEDIRRGLDKRTMTGLRGKHYDEDD